MLKAKQLKPEDFLEVLEGLASAEDPAEYIKGKATFLHKQAAARLKDDKKKLTDKAETEASACDLELRRYKGVLSLLSNSAFKRNPQFLLAQIVRKYKTSKVDIKEAVSDKRVQTLAIIYPKKKEEFGSELLHMNFTIDDKTTFIHALFEADASREVIQYYLLRVQCSIGSNPDLVAGYMGLSDINGISIADLIKQKSTTEKYQDLDKEFPEFFPGAKVAINVNTHTASVHKTVNESFARLAVQYGGEAVSTTDSSQIIEVDRTAEWNEGIDRDIKAFETQMRDILSSDEKLEAFLSPTLLPSEDMEQASREFRFKAATTLRMIDGLKAGQYGGTEPSHFRIHADNPDNCGVTPKEMVALGYRALQDKSPESWGNVGQVNQHLMSFIYNLYKSKRGYNIDEHGEREWETHSQVGDRNKCRGGTVNQIAYGLQDHKAIEIKVVDVETMKGPLSKLLPVIVNDLMEGNKEAINGWLQVGIISEDLKNKIKSHLQNHDEFSKEFSQDEISRLGSQVLRSLDTHELLVELQDKYPDAFPHEDLAIDDKN